MLEKLMKWDFKALFRMVLPIYTIVFGLAILTRIFGLIADRVIIVGFVSGFLNVVFVISIVLLPFLVYVVSIVKFYQSMTRDEGYLTHTLPVSKNKLVTSKFLVAIITMLSCLLVMIFCLFITYFNSDVITTISNFIKNLFGELNTMLVIMLVLSIAFGYLLQLALTFLAIAMGGMHQQKLLFTFVYGFVIYTVIQILITIVFVIVMLIDPNLYASLDSETLSLDSANTILAISNVLSIIFTVACLIGSIKVLDKRLNLE